MVDDGAFISVAAWFTFLDPLPMEGPIKPLLSVCLSVCLLACWLFGQSIRLSVRLSVLEFFSEMGHYFFLIFCTMLDKILSPEKRGELI